MAPKFGVALSMIVSDPLGAMLRAWSRDIPLKGVTTKAGAYCRWLAMR